MCAEETKKERLTGSLNFEASGLVVADVGRVSCSSVTDRICEIRTLVATYGTYDSKNEKNK